MRDVTVAIVFLLASVTGGCDTSKRSNMSETSNPAPLTFLALGDSYTIGEGVPEAERWPVLVARTLRQRGVNLADPIISARTGWTTDELAAAIDAADIDGRRFDLVTLLIGVNNQYRGRDQEEYRGQFRDLLRRAVAFADGAPSRVIVVSIPDWGVTPFARDRDRAQVARAIDEFNRVNREESASAGARYVDITRTSRAHPELIAPDNLHPSGAMYAKWAELILPEASKALTSPTRP